MTNHVKLTSVNFGVSILLYIAYDKERINMDYK